MWAERKPSWLRTVVHGGVVLPRIWRRTMFVTAVSVVVTFLYLRVPALGYSITATPFTLIALPLGIFLGFRNNAAYDRFWEGRKLWGQLVNTSRSVTRQVLTLIVPQADATETSPAAVRALQERFVRTVIAYVHAFRHHLRDEPPFDTVAPFLATEEVEALRRMDNVPYGILQLLGEQLAVARRNKWIDPLHVPLLEGSLTVLTDVQGACERIKSTPVPYSYNVLLHRIVAVYCFGLPFGLAETIKWATPLVVLGVSYAFFGLDAIGDEVEQPFGTDTNDLPLETISRTIESNLRVRIGEEPLAPRAPEEGVLS
jgi:putative membrane protein